MKIMAYDPRRPHEHRYVLEPQTYPDGLLERVERDALTLCRALGYDLNTVEFAVEDGVPYAIDFMNPAPDADRHSVGEENFEWIVDRVAKLAVKKAATAGAPMQGLRWSGFLTGEPMKKTETKKPAAKMPTGAEMKSEERNEPLKVKAHEEDMRAQNVKAARAAVTRAQLPPRKR